ncbi:MAG: Holliday junction branch migration protein RuvA [Microthrixaceae bacterium]
MIGSLRGELLNQSSAELLVEVAGLGYRVQVTPAVVEQVGPVGSEVFLHVHHHQREDAGTLFGFTSIDERRVFETLISAHGVGPSMGLAILSVHSPLGLRQILATEDIDGLCMVPGVGKKTAARLMIELKTKLKVPEGTAVNNPAEGPSGVGNSARTDVREALLGLGYGPEEVSRVLVELPELADSADLLRQALQLLSAG